MILHGSVRRARNFLDVAETSDAERDQGRAVIPGNTPDGRSEAETAMDVADRCSDDTGPSLALHSELVQSLWESSGKRKLLSHPKGPSDRRDGILCTAVKAVLCKHLFSLLKHFR